MRLTYDNPEFRIILIMHYSFIQILIFMIQLFL